MTVKFVIPDNFEWWQQRLDGWKRVNDGWMALCPAHEDRNPSLHFTVHADGNFIFHCFAGCKWMAVMSAASAMEARGPGATRVETEVEREVAGTGVEAVATAVAERSVVPSGGSSAFDWWVERTGVPREEWEAWGVREGNGGSGSRIEFAYPGKKYYKFRNPTEGDKDIAWHGKPPASVLWPSFKQVGEPADGLIWLGEGEGDTGVLRHLGFSAFTAGGTDNPKGEEMLPTLNAWGITQVLVCLDADMAGKKAAKKLVNELISLGLRAAVVDITPLLRLRDDEKDITELYLREGFAETRKALLELSEEIWKAGSSVTSSAYAARAPQAIDWIVEPLLVRGSLTLLCGVAKGGKTTFTFALMRELRSGGLKGFLGRDVRAATVLYMTEDSPAVWRIRRDTHLGSDIGGMVPLDDHIRIMSLSDEEISKRGWEERLQVVERDVKAFGADVIVVDTVPIWSDMEDENNSTQVNRALEPLRRLAERSGAAVLALHYYNKSGSSRGSTSFDAIPDILLDLRSEAGRDGRVLEVRSKISALGNDPIHYELVQEGQEHEKGQPVGTLHVVDKLSVVVGGAGGVGGADGLDDVSDKAALKRRIEHELAIEYRQSGGGGLTVKALQRLMDLEGDAAAYQRIRNVAAAMEHAGDLRAVRSGREVTYFWRTAVS